MSKRRPDYVRANRADYRSKKRRVQASRAIESRWKQSVPPLQEVTNTITPTGSRIVDLENLAEGVCTISTHSANCGGPCILEDTKCRAGLAVILIVRCTKCQKKFEIHTSSKVQNQKGMWQVNIAAVLGQVITGGGCAQLNNSLAPMNIPGMSKRLFTRTEQLLHDEIKDLLVGKMIEAGCEELKLAEERGDFHQGVPAITVVVDGGWSKRSHKHSYNAKSGVAVIFGQNTRKLLFIGVRNKYCSICATCEHQARQPPQHRCFRNWSGSSSAMESDILVEGFRASEVTHGVRYMRIIGDGDSSVMANLVQAVPYGPFIHKIECANHACKCYRTRLEQLAKDHPEYRGRGGLTKRVIQRLTIGARVAIRMHSQTRDIQQLRHDLRNGPSHVFGNHSKCNPSFCKTREADIHHSDSSDNDSDENEEANTNIQDATISQQLYDIIDQECDNLPTATDEFRAQSRRPPSIVSIPAGLLDKIAACGDRLVMLSSQLIDNETSNLAECYMSIRCRYDGGKQMNRIQSGSFEMRCFAAGMRMQDGPTWPVEAMEHITRTECGQVGQWATQHSCK